MDKGILLQAVSEYRWFLRNLSNICHMLGHTERSLKDSRDRSATAAVENGDVFVGSSNINKRPSTSRGPRRLAVHHRPPAFTATSSTPVMCT